MRLYMKRQAKVTSHQQSQTVILTIKYLELDN